MPPMLPGPKVLYKRLVKSAIVGALRAAFSEEYTDDPTFTSLHVVQDFNLEQIRFPMLVVGYNGNFTENVGVGHTEIWLTHRGYERHMRRRFEGQISFDIYTRSPEDRDAIFDALTDLFGFGKLEVLLDNFFQYIYHRDIGVAYTLMLNEDTHTDKGDNVIKPWWSAEDVLIFSGGITMEIHGTFTSVIENPEETLGFINRIIVYPYVFGYEDAPDPEPLIVEWLGTINSEDNAYVSGEGVVSSAEEYTLSP